MSNIIERVYDIPTLCKEINITEDAFNKMHIMDRLVLLTNTLNEGWDPDYEDKYEYKYTIWFNFSNGIWSYGECDYEDSYANSAAHLFYKNPELAIHAATKFIALYREFLSYNVSIPAQVSAVVPEQKSKGIIELKSTLQAVRFMPNSDDVSYEVFGKVYPIEYIDGKRYIDLDPNFTNGGGIAYESCYIFKNLKGDIWVDEELPPYYEVQE